MGYIIPLWSCLFKFQLDLVYHPEKHDSVEIKDGVFRLNIGKGVAQAGNFKMEQLVSKEKIYLELWIDGERLSPRQRIGSVAAVLKAEKARYADSVVNAPKINVGAFDATKVTTGVFDISKIPELTTAHFKGTFAEDKLPSIKASQFNLSEGKTISSDRLPATLSASVITGSTPFSLDYFDGSYLTTAELTYDVGVAKHLEAIPIPDAFKTKGSRCSYLATASTLSKSVAEGLDQLFVTVDGNYVVSCKYKAFGSNAFHECWAEYIYVCVK